MRILTVNLPESYLKALDSLVGENAIYPSRSEVIRVAIREYLIKEMATIPNWLEFREQMMKESKKKE